LVANLATLVGLGVVWCEKPILGKTVRWGRWGSGRTPTTHPTQKQKPKEKKKTKPNQTKPFVPTSINLQKERPTTHPQNKNTKKSLKI